MQIYCGQTDRRKSSDVDEISSWEDVIAALRAVIDDIEKGRLKGGGWREQFIASAIGLLACGCYAKAATHVAQARRSAAIQLDMGSLQQLRRGVDLVTRLKEITVKSSA